MAVRIATGMRASLTTPQRGHLDASQRPNLTEDGCIENRERLLMRKKQPGAPGLPHIPNVCGNMRVAMLSRRRSIRPETESMAKLRIVIGCAQRHVGGRQVGQLEFYGNGRNGRPPTSRAVLNAGLLADLQRAAARSQ